MTDPRSTFATPSVAHESLKGIVSAQRFTSGEPLRVAKPTAGIRNRPGATGLQREALYGHRVTVLETANPCAFGRHDAMGYVGFFHPADLAAWISPTHCVIQRATLLFTAPDFKSPDPLAISIGSHLSVQNIEGRYARTKDGHYAITSHLAPVNKYESDPVAVAERLLGTPYLWGGNSAFGIDCSGLVQLGCMMCNIPCPGDSDLQQAHFPAAQTDDYRRGDLLFWKGHVAWVADPETLLHANAHHMAVAHEPIREAIARIAAQGDGPVTGHARLPQL